MTKMILLKSQNQLKLKEEKIQNGISNIKDFLWNLLKRLFFLIKLFMIIFYKIIFIFREDDSDGPEENEDHNKAVDSIKKSFSKYR